MASPPAWTQHSTEILDVQQSEDRISESFPHRETLFVDWKVAQSPQQQALTENIPWVEADGAPNEHGATWVRVQEHEEGTDDGGKGKDVD
jgi:hypothetical protein